MSAPEFTKSCLYCKGPLSASPGARHPTPEDYRSAMEALTQERIKSRALLDRAEQAEEDLRICRERTDKVIRASVDQYRQRAEAAESALAREREARDEDVRVLKTCHALLAVEAEEHRVELRLARAEQDNEAAGRARARVVAHRKDREEA